MQLVTIGKDDQSELYQVSFDDIKGLGNEKKLFLLKEFGSVEALSKAGKEELLSHKGIGEKMAESILHYFKENKGE